MRRRKLKYRIKDWVMAVDRVCGWEPSAIFYTTTSKYRSYDKPHVEGNWLTGISTSNGYFDSTRHYTKLGKIMEAMPILIMMVIAGIWYLCTWPPMLIVYLVWGLIKGILFPSSWF